MPLKHERTGQTSGSPQLGRRIGFHPLTNTPPRERPLLILLRLTGTLDIARDASTGLDTNRQQEKESPNAKRVEKADFQPKPQRNLEEV